MFTARRASSLLAFCLSLFCTFSTATALDLDPKQNLAVPGDFNGDGRMDMLLQPLTTKTKGSILLQDGTGKLRVVAQDWDPGYLGLDWSTSASTLTTADLNGDGQDDVLMQPVKAGGTAAVLITDPTAQLLQITQLLPAGYLGMDWSSATHKAVAGDFDGDRHKEVFMQAARPGDLGAIVHADQTGQLVAVIQSFADGYLGRHWNAKDENLYVGDFNGDGRQDLLVQSRGPVPGESAYALLMADGSGQFTRISETWNDKDLGADWNPINHKIVIEDANHDGIMDIVVQSTVKNGTNYLFQGNAQGLITQPAARWTGNKSASDVLNKTTGTTKPGTGISVVVTPSGPTSKIITAPTNPEQDPTIPRLGQGAQGSGLIMTANAAGVLQGSGGVSGGTATYSIPIAVSPGIAGMQPSVSLNYSSRGGNGEMGMGWSVSAGSQIHRCPATQAMDGYSAGVTYTSTDRLCLDGQHLISVQGTYGTDGAKYRTELDSFVLITESNDISDPTCKFTVQEKDGHTLTYGDSTVSDAAFVPSGAPAPLAWGLAIEKDTNNNNIIYYYSTFGTGEYLLTSISYTGSGATAGNRTVNFNYTTRADVSTQYLAGGLTTQSQVLTSITNFENGALVRTYSTEYTTSGATGRTLLAGVQECAGLSANQACLPETTFSWHQPALHFGTPTTIDATDPCGQYAVLPSRPNISSLGDINGDGYKDILFTAPPCGSQGSGISSVYLMGPGGELGTPINTPTHLNFDQQIVADMDGDGRADLVGYTTSNGVDYLAYSSYDPGTNSFTTPAVYSNIPYYNIITVHNNPVTYAGVVAVVDVDGDGLPDIVAVVPDPNHSGYHMLGVYLNTTQPCTAPCQATVKFANDPLYMGITVPDYTDVNGNVYILSADSAGDMDGNGLPDFSVVYFDSNFVSHQFWIFAHSTGPDSPPTFTKLDQSTDGRQPWALNANMMDINGDGLPDAVYDCGANNSTDLCYVLNTGQPGTGMFAGEVDTGVDDWRHANPQASAGSMTADIDNDGQQEIIYPGAMLAEYCDEEAHWPNGEMGESCAVSGGHPLPADSDFSVYQYYAIKFLPQPNGSGGFKYIPTLSDTNLVGQSHVAVPIDLQGDGLTGLVSPFSSIYISGQLHNLGDYSHPHGLHVALNSAGSSTSQNGAPDLMLTATNGFGHVDQWDYYPLSSTQQFNHLDLYDSPGPAGNGYSGGDYFFFSSSMYVVGDYSYTNGAGGTNTHDFHYGQAIYNNQGRGFQGFRTVVDDDMASGARTVQVYHQRFPLSGELQESWTTTIADPVSLLTPTYDAGNHSVVSHVLNTWGCLQGGQTVITVDGISCTQPLTASTYLPVLQESVATNFDVASHDPLSTTDTQYCPASGLTCGGSGSNSGYDAYGNAMGSVSVTTDPYGTYTSSVVNTYAAPDLTNWWVNKLTDKVTNVQASYIGVSPAAATRTRTTHYDYYNTRLVNHIYAHADGIAANEIDTQYVYANGNVTSAAVSAQGATGTITRTTTTTYTTGADANYFVASVTDPVGLTTSSVPDSRFGLPGTVTAPDGAVTNNTYDVFGRLISTQVGSLPAQTTSYITHTSGDGCDSTSTASQYYVLVNQTGYPSHYTCYDMFNRAIRAASESFSSSGDLVCVNTNYDGRGRVTGLSEPHFSSQSTFAWNYTYYDDTNILGRVREKLDAKGIETDYGYTDLVTTITTIPPDSPERVDQEVKNSLGKMMSVTNAVGAPEQAATSYGYDSDGNPVTITADDASTITAQFDVLGHKTSVADPDQGTTTYTYDGFGDLLTQTDAKTQVQTMGYDPDGRMISKSTSVSGELPVTWIYDTCSHGAGKLCSVVQGDGTPAGTPYREDYGYDNLGRAVSDIETIATTPYETDTSYDSDGRVGTVTYPDSIADQPPISNAGPTQYVLPNTSVTLNGSASYDPDNGPQTTLGYQWTQIAGPSVTLANSTTASLSFTTTGTLGTSYTFQLTVDDGLSDNVNTDTNTVTVTVPNVPPAPADLTDTGDTDHDGTYTVSWNTVSVTGTSIVYHLEEAGGTSSGPTASWNEIYAGSTNSTSVSHPGNGYYYYWYRVRAEDKISGASIGYGPYSSTDDIHVVVTPGAPSSISPSTGSTSTGSYSISWGAFTGSVKSADVYYQLQEANNTGFSPAAIVYTGTALYDDITKNTLSDFYYRVEACNKDGTVTVCSDWKARAHEIVTGTGGGGGQQQQVIRVPGAGTSLSPAPATGNVGMAMPDKQSVVPSEVAPIQELAVVPQATAPKPNTVRPRSHGARPIFASPLYKAWADAKLQDATGTTTYARFSVTYLYSTNGYLSKLVDGADNNRIYWKVNGSAAACGTGEIYCENGMNAYGQVTDAVYGGGAVTTHYGYDGKLDYLDTIGSNNGGTTIYQNLAYTWEAVGNLMNRTSNATASNPNTLKEIFTYDLHNRLLTSTVSNATGDHELSQAYDSVGDITCKSDVVGSACAPGSGGYTYGGTAGPHAVTAAGANTYAYDPDGNMTTRNMTINGVSSSNTIAWDSDNLPTSITQDANNYSNFSYAPDKHRYMQTAMNGGNPETTIYAGGLEMVTTSTGTEYRHTISAYGKPVMLDTLSTGTGGVPTEAKHYLLTDHLGSVDAVVADTGGVEPQESFDAFGQRRDAGSWYGPMASTDLANARKVTHRGFTHHEHLDNLSGLVHMNGRIYDPTVGRFMSVDPIFQAPTNSQSVNPYSYVMNNPLSLVDPSGYAAEAACSTGAPGSTPSCDPSNQQSKTDPDKKPSDTGRKYKGHNDEVETGSHTRTADTGASCGSDCHFENTGNGHIAVQETRSIGIGSASDINSPNLRDDTTSGADRGVIGGGSISFDDDGGKDKKVAAPCDTDDDCQLINRQVTRIVGGNGTEQKEVQDTLDAIESTPRGRALIHDLADKGRVIEIRIVKDLIQPDAKVGGAFFNVEPDFNKRVWTDTGTKQVSLLDQVAHELGHSVTGIKDDGPGNMHNINMNENPITTYLGERPRVKYDFVPDN